MFSTYTLSLSEEDSVRLEAAKVQGHYKTTAKLLRYLVSKELQRVFPGDIPSHLLEEMQEQHRNESELRVLKVLKLLTKIDSSVRFGQYDRAHYYKDKAEAMITDPFAPHPELRGLYDQRLKEIREGWAKDHVVAK